MLDLIVEAIVDLFAGFFFPDSSRKKKRKNREKKRL